VGVVEVGVVELGVHGGWRCTENYCGCVDWWLRLGAF